MIFRVIARLAEMTIVKAKRAGLTHPGFRRALIQLRNLTVRSLVITNSNLGASRTGELFQDIVVQE